MVRNSTEMLVDYACFSSAQEPSSGRHPNLLILEGVGTDGQTHQFAIEPELYQQLLNHLGLHTSDDIIGRTVVVVEETDTDLPPLEQLPEIVLLQFK